MPVQPCDLLARPTTPREATPPPGWPSARWPSSKFSEPTIWPATTRLRASALHPVTFAWAKQAAAPQGPFGAVASAHVFRFRRSVCAISWSVIERSSS